MNTFLVGVDGSEASTAAVRWAAGAAKLEGAELKLVGVYSTSTSDYAPGLVIPEDVIEAIRQDARDAVIAAADVATEVEPNLSVSSIIVDGDPAKALLELGEDASAIVLGTRGLGSVKGLFFGSVSISVAAHSHGRVVVVTGAGSEASGPSGKGAGSEASGARETGAVVVGADGSDISEPAVAEAFAQASRWGAPLVAVHTWAPIDADALHGYGIDPDEVEQMSERASDTLTHQLARHGAKFPDVTVQRTVLPEEPAKALLDAAGDTARLIVVGSRGRGGFTGLLLGSTSQKVLRQANCPVMVVRT